MYTIHADGEKMFDSLSEDPATLVLSPKVSLNINKSGSMSCVMLPENIMHNSLKKLKSIVTVEQDGEQIFRGRVTETKNDLYNQKSVYCEGEKSFLLDSVHEPYTYSGTVRGLFQKLITNHNSMVDATRRFTVGTITAVSATEETEVETTSYADTYTEIEDRLLNVYDGYLRTRTVGNAHYIDWVKEYGEENSQPIEFSVNLLDLTDNSDANDVFTVLIPLGASEINDDGEYTDPLSIESVNNGLKYIQDDEGVALYGKIWKTYTWSYIEDADELMEKGREYLKTGVALDTLKLKAIDMHFTDGDIQPIRIGDKVRILSDPHGIDKTMVCSRIEIDLRNPENTEYYFGESPRTLTDNYVETEEEVTGGHGGGGVKKEVGELKRWAYLRAVPELGRIEGLAWDVNDLTGRTGEVELYMDAVESVVKLKAERSIFNEIDDKVTSAELRLDGAEAQIEMKVEKNGVISAINMTTEEITIDSAKINLEGYVTARQLEAKIAEITFAYSSKLETIQLIASQGEITGDLIVSGDMHYGGKLCNWVTDKYVVTSVKYPGLARKKLSELSDSDYVVTAYNTSWVSYPGAVSGGNIDYLSFVSGGE